MNMSSNLSYTQTGDYLLPNLTLHQPKTPLGKYGRLRRTYLKKHRPVLYNTMLLNGTPVPAPDGTGADGREPDAADAWQRTAEAEPGPGQGAEPDWRGCST